MSNVGFRASTKVSDAICHFGETPVVSNAGLVDDDSG